MSNAVVVRQCLEGYGDRIAPNDREQLARILEGDFAGLNSAIVPDLIALRLQRPEYAKFFQPDVQDAERNRRIQWA